MPANSFDEFLHNVEVGRPDECWPWLLTPDSLGYGMTMFGKEHVRSHRAAYQHFHKKKLLKHIVVRHTCNNPPCCNPAHLIEGTQADNMADMVKANRQSSGKNSGRHTSPSRTARGENSNSKLTENSVRAIRFLYERCGISERRIASFFEVGASTVRHIINRDSWKHIDDIS